MADFRMFDVPVAIARNEAMAATLKLLEAIPEAQQPFAERYDNPNLRHHSAATLVVAARDDHQVRGPHGTDILVSGLVLVVAAQQKRLEELEAEATAKATKGSTKR